LPVQTGEVSGEQSWPAWATEPVDLVDADPNWTVRGEQERGHLETLLAPWLTARVEHIGSTAIPDLPAKPIIDLQAPVTDLGDLDPIAAALAPHDWHYVDPDLDQRPWRRFFVKVTDGRRSAHLQVMTSDSPRWHQQIAFRDALRADPILTADYAALKHVLAAKHADDREAYTAAKSDFIRTVLDGSTQ
jgi:GrpB-like predicted nucleotidyltransferase (UPF0157 family)